MISETRLARAYSSFWRSMAPTMELYVKRCNLSGYERNFEPIYSTVHPDRRGITNLIAFEVFNSLVADDIRIDRLDAATEQAERLDFAVNAIPIDVSNLTPDEFSEAGLLARRMWLHFNYPKIASVVTKPKFRGCGIVLSCCGDALTADDTIIEFKDGDRPFRSYEFRQLSVYAALFYNEHRRLPKAISVLNSRRGTYVEVEFEQFTSEVAGRSGLDYVNEIIEMISAASVP